MYRPSARACAACVVALSSWLCVLLAQGCYDHRITQTIQARRARAKEAEGATLGGDAPRSGIPARHVGRIRFYVADAYRRTHPAWQRQLEALVERASGLMRTSFGVGLEVSELHAWTPGCDVAKLAECLDELSAFETADDGEWVVGVLPAEPRFVTSFDELGMAHVPGRHLVIRDVSDVAEREAIARAFATHTQARRDEIYARRKEHKRLAVFLHELAHTLGGLHQSERESVMHPSYDDSMSDFDAANALLIAASLEDAFDEPSGHAKLQAALEQSSADAFEANARDELLARLSAPEQEEVVTASGGHPYVIRGEEAVLLVGLAEPERALYRESVRLLEAGDATRALQTLAPLVTAFPQNYAVQHLACGLAMQLGLGADIQLVCARAQGLARSQPAQPS